MIFYRGPYLFYPTNNVKGYIIPWSEVRSTLLLRWSCAFNLDLSWPHLVVLLEVHYLMLLWPICFSWRVDWHKPIWFSFSCLRAEAFMEQRATILESHCEDPAFEIRKCVCEWILFIWKIRVATRVYGKTPGKPFCLGRLIFLLKNGYFFLNPLKNKFLWKWTLETKD